MNRAQSKMRDIIVHSCYLHAGEDPVMSDACDLFEADSNKLLWNNLDYTDMLQYNEQKYTFVYERMPKHIFEHMVEEFKPIKEELDELLDEVESHKIVVVNNIKEYVKKRTKGIMIFSDVYPDLPKPKILSYKMDVKQIITDKNAKHIELNIPETVRLDGSVELFHHQPDKFKAYGGNGKYTRPVNVENKKKSLLKEHEENYHKHLFHVDEPEPDPIKVKMIKDYGEEAEMITIPGEPPKNFMEEFHKTNNLKEHQDEMQMATYLHHNTPYDIQGHYYGENPVEHSPHTRKLRRVRVYHRHRPIKKWHHLV